jgi:hypothetical protein
VPVVAPNIDVGQRSVARTYFEFADAPISWNKIPQNSIQALRVAQAGEYQSGRLTATVANDSYDNAKNVKAIAVLFDSQGVARDASVATIPSVGARSEQSVTFTWPEAVPDIIRAEVTVLPSF